MCQFLGAWREEWAAGTYECQKGPINIKRDLLR
jgi:hypothetical protein